MKWLITIILCCYPPLIYFGLKLSPNLVAYAIIALGFLRFSYSYWQKPKNKVNLITGVVLIFIGFIALVLKNNEVFKTYPILVSAILLAVFAISLKQQKTIIEKFASLHDKNITPNKKIYLRKLTIIWCAFFFINIVLSITTAFMDFKIWTLYNGLISYILMGLLFAGEFIYRKLILRY